MSDRSDISTMTGFLLGAVVGAGIALLLAPGPGEETRKKVGSAARHIGNRASDMMSHAREEGSSGTSAA